MKKYKYILPAFSGVFLSISYSSKNMWWLAFFALIPLFINIFKYCDTKKSIALSVMIFSVFYYVPLLVWLKNLVPAIPVPEKTGNILIITGTFIIGILQGIYYIPTIIFFPYIRRNRLTDCVYISSLFTLVEFFQEKTPLLPFPWSKAGTIVSSFTPFIQSASLFGTLFVSFLVYIINALIAFIILNHKDKALIKSSATMAVCVFVINTLFGVIRTATFKDNKNISAMCVQGNFSGLDKWRTSSNDMFFEYKRLTLKNSFPHTDIILWPETAVPVDLNAHPEYKQELIQLSATMNSVIVTGFFISEGDKEYNTVIAFSPDGTVSEPYKKRVLVPFGEAFPFVDFFKKYMPFLTESINISDGMASGTKAIALQTSLCRVGGIICYESVFPSLSRESVLKGSQVLMLPSNDSWFGDSPALYQHHCNAVMRAVENNRYLMRSSNTGITSVISPRGKILSSSARLTATVCKADISLIDKKTLYTKIGNVIVLPFIFVYLYSIFCFVKHKSKVDEL